MTERLQFHFSLSCIGEGNGNPFQCSCLENPRDGGAWWAAVYGVAQSRTRLKWLSSRQKLALGSGLAERMCAYSVTQPCPTLCYPMDYKSPVSSVHGILQAKILEWVAISFSSRKDDTWSKTLCHFTISIYSHQIVWEESTLWLQQGLKLKLFFISTIIFLHQMYIN